MALLLGGSSLEYWQVHSHFITDNGGVLSYLQPRLLPAGAVRVGVSLADKEGAVPATVMGAQGSGMDLGRAQIPSRFPSLQDGPSPFLFGE